MSKKKKKKWKLWCLTCLLEIILFVFKTDKSGYEAFFANMSWGKSLDNYDIAGLVMEWLIVQQKHGHLIIFLIILVWMSLPFMTYFKRPLIDFTGMWVVWKENTNPNIIKKNTIRIDLFIRKSYSPKWGCSVIDNHAYLKVFLVIKHTEGCHYWSNERPTVLDVVFFFFINERYCK